VTVPTVLVVTARDDHTADLVVRQLHERHSQQVRVARIDPADDTYPLEMEVELKDSHWQGVIAQGPTEVRVQHVGAVFWRWAWEPKGHPDVTDEEARLWASRQDGTALFGTLKSLDQAYWVNHPDNAARAVPKPVQLSVAVKCGFEVPATAIMTSGSAAALWARYRCIERETLYKAFHCLGTIEGGMIPAAPVDVDELPPELYAASIFQRIINGTHVRLTAITDQVFASEIHGAKGLDWRPEQQDTKFVPIEVPAAVRKQVRQFMRHFGLNYGAFDFVIHSDRWWFLEVNPTGQYGFVEIRTDQPISATLAATLAQEADRDRSEASAGVIFGMAG
jgi:hypothetical protein